MPGTGWQRRNPSGGGASRLPALLLTGLSGCLWPVVCLMRATQCQGGSRLAPGTGGGGRGQVGAHSAQVHCQLDTNHQWRNWRARPTPQAVLVCQGGGQTPSMSFRTDDRLHLPQEKQE